MRGNMHSHSHHRLIKGQRLAEKCPMLWSETMFTKNYSTGRKAAELMKFWSQRGQWLQFPHKPYMKQVWGTGRVSQAVKFGIYSLCDLPSKHYPGYDIIM
jgi:hypothetical protein